MFGAQHVVCCTHAGRSYFSAFRVMRLDHPHVSSMCLTVCGQDKEQNVTRQSSVASVTSDATHH